MATKTTETKLTIESYKARKREMDAIVARMVGVHEAAKMHPRGMRRRLAKQLGAISASKMIIEAR